VIVLGVVVLIQTAFVVFQVLAWRNPQLGQWLDQFLPERAVGNLLVASVAALMVGPSMILVAYFRDFPRGYFIAVMIALAVFLMVYLNHPVYPIIIGALIALPGLVLFLRFLQKYPLPREESPHEHAG
jgi:Ca2+/Na+ antiporter